MEKKKEIKREEETSKEDYMLEKITIDRNRERRGDTEGLIETERHRLTGAQ